jgi:hypothetical protein
MSTVHVRPADRDSDRQELMSILHANLPDLPHARRFDWLYRANPDGAAWSWFVCEPSGRAVGVTSLFPRSVWLADKTAMCGQVGDFAIAASHRSLGPAVMLQKATFGPVDNGALAFCYDCPPHQAGMSTFRRLGMKPNCRVDRYALPLRVEGRLRKRLGPGAAVPAVAGNLLLRMSRRWRQKPNTKSLNIGEHLGPFTEEFSRLDDEVPHDSIIRGRRTTPLLNWRYREDPLQQYHVFTARESGELIAFVVLRLTDDVVTVVDVFGNAFPDSAYALLASVFERYQRSHQTVDAYLSAGSSLIGCFESMGFRRRSEAAHVVAYAPSGSEVSAHLQGGLTWAFQQAEMRV